MDNTALYKLSYGLYVLTAKDNGVDNGCIVNTVVQVTSSPLTATVAVNKQNLTHDMIKNTGLFNVSILTEEAPFEVYRHFGMQSGRTVNKFADCETETRSPNGLLYIPKYTNAYLSMRITDTRDLGTHTMFFAEIEDGAKLSDVESVTYSYYQANVKPKPAPPVSGKTVWRCKICGYEYEGEVLPADFICPICKHGAVDFEKIQK